MNLGVDGEDDEITDQHFADPAVRQRQACRNGLKGWARSLQ